MASRKYLYLLALARERHFGRAALACHVSQPTLSNAIRQLEDDFGVPLVERGRVFRGFTAAGLQVLDHARQVVADEEALTQALKGWDRDLGGMLRIGAIPTSLPITAHITAPFAERYPGVSLRLLSHSSRDIQRGLDEFELDAGITYLDNEPLSGVRMRPLYNERYFLLTQRSAFPASVRQVTWAQAARQRLCLLTTDMQNRRIIEAAFRMADHPVTAASETNSLMNLYTTVRQGPWSSIVPGQLLALFPPVRDVIALPLVAPLITHVVGLVYADRTPEPPPAKALAALVTEAGIAERLRETVDAALRQWNSTV